MWWGAHDGMGWWMVFGGLWMLLFWGAIIALVVWGIRVPAGPRPGAAGEDDPLEIARRRYARGEITVQELDGIERRLAGTGA